MTKLVLLSPFVFLTYLYTLYDGIASGAKEAKAGSDNALFLWCASAVPFAAVVATALHSKVEGNWAVAAYIAGLVAVAVVWVRLWERRAGWGRILGRAWVGVGVSLAVVLAVAALFPNLLYSAGLKFPHAADDRTNELHGWKSLATRVQTERSAMGTDPFVFGINYRMPSEAAFYLPGHPETYALFLNYKASEYLFWENPDKLKSRDAIFLNDTDTQDHFR